MNGKEDIIKNNLKNAAEHERLSNVIIRSQLWEAAALLKDATAQRCAAFFEETFSKSPLCTEMLELSMMLSAHTHLKKGTDDATVAYMRNPLTLKALKALTADINTVRISEVQDFKSACEAVASEEADYCIIPYCSSSDGYYPTFMKLIKSFDLKLLKTVRLQKPDSDEELQFSLLSKELEQPENPENILISFSEENEDTLSRLITALNGSGYKIRSILSSPLEYNMDKLEHRIDIYLDSNSFGPILFFFEGCLPSHNVLGIYQSV